MVGNDLTRMSNNGVHDESVDILDRNINDPRLTLCMLKVHV